MDKTYRQALIEKARDTLSKFVPARYSPEMTDEEVVNLASWAVMEVSRVLGPIIEEYADELRELGIPLPTDD